MQFTLFWFALLWRRYCEATFVKQLLLTALLPSNDSKVGESSNKWNSKIVKDEDCFKIKEFSRNWGWSLKLRGGFFKLKVYFDLALTTEEKTFLSDFISILRMSFLKWKGHTRGQRVPCWGYCNVHAVVNLASLHNVLERRGEVDNLHTNPIRFVHCQPDRNPGRCSTRSKMLTAYPPATCADWIWLRLLTKSLPWVISRAYRKRSFSNRKYNLNLAWIVDEKRLALCDFTITLRAALVN